MAGPGESPLALAPVFGEHMVLQQGVPLPIEGYAAPGAKVAVALGTARAETQASHDGHWRITLRAQAPGRALALAVSSQGKRLTVSDVAIGEVYLCAGQSNMEWGLADSTGGAEAVAAASNADLRLLRIVPDFAPAPRPTWRRPPMWQQAGPATVGAFSAACYFMGRAIQQQTGMPVGLVSAAVGGSIIEAWLSSPGYTTAGLDPARQAAVKQLAEDPATAYRAWGAAWEGWWRLVMPQAGAPWQADFAPPEPWLAELAAAPWDRWDLAGLDDDHHGLVFFTTSVDIDAVPTDLSIRLDLGVIQEMDQTWVNGTAIGATYGRDIDRSYAVPPGVLHPGRNRITVAIDSRWMTGGFRGDRPRQLRLGDGSVIPLDRGWRYWVAPTAAGAPQPPWSLLAGPAVLYNAMIAPLGPFPFRAVAWYQGESNAGVPGYYQRALQQLMADWRRQSRAATGWLIVQLPNFGKPGAASYNAGWAYLREAQRRAVLADANARLVVTIDQGEAGDIHPKDKRVIGARLAAEAQALAAGVPGQTLAPAGMEGTAEQPRLRFSGAIRLRPQSTAPGPFVACRADTGHCRSMEGRIEDGAVVLSALAPGEDSIRYCWAANPDCTLVDASGVPITPFQAARPRP